MSAVEDRRGARWDVSAGAGNYAALVAGQLASAALSFLALVIVSRALGTSGYGRVAALLAVSQAVSQLALNWTALSLYRHGCEEFVATGRIAASFWNRFYLLLASALVVAATARWWLPALAAWLDLPGEAAWLVPAHILASALAVQVQYALLASKLPRFQALASAASRGALVLALGAGALQGTLSWAGVCLLYAGVPLFESLLGLAKARRLLLPVRGFDRALLGRMLRFSLPLTIHGLLGYLVTNHLDAFFILKLRNAAELGVYAVAFQLAGTFMQIAALGGSLLLSLFVTLDAEGESEKLDRYFGEALPVLTLVWTAGSVLLPVVGGTLLETFFDPSFASSAELLGPLSVASAAAGPVLLGLGPLLNARSATYISAALAAVSALVNVAGNALLIPELGLAGCAWATAAAYGAGTLTALALSARLVAVPLPPARYAVATLPALLAALAPGLGGAASGLAVCGVIALVQRRSFGPVLRRLGAALAPRFAPSVPAGGRDA